jgi:hypothetical protein
LTNQQARPSVEEEQDVQPSKSARSITSKGPSFSFAGTKLAPSIPVIRFERVGPKEWVCKESKIYNLESLVLQSGAVFCLLDESRLSAEEVSQRRLASQSSGIVSLHVELQQRGALVTSWPKSEHPLLMNFLESLMAQELQVSLADFWLYQAIGGRTSDPRWAATRGGGVIAYEVLMQVGIVLRKNEALGIVEDCWRLIYPKNLERDSASGTFGAFLCKTFPQLRSVFARLSSTGGGGEGLCNVVVTYCSHEIEPPVCAAPPFDASAAFQTIGCLDEPFVDVLASFDTSDLSFHDLVLMM